MARKDPAAVSLGRRGGLKGGRARAQRLTPAERSESARYAVMARWKKAGLVSESTGSYRGIPTGISANPTLLLMDCFEWMENRLPNSIHAIVTDPPYGLLEFSEIEKTKLRKGRGGVWRIPPSFDGTVRSPLPRFTVLKERDHDHLVTFFARWGKLALKILVPGGHAIVATNPLVSDLLCSALRSAGLEKRGEIIRLVQTLRGGDRPKNAHEEFPSVSVMPRSAHEPWVVFRKPCIGRVQDNLRKFSTGGFQRPSGDRPFVDVIDSRPTRSQERQFVNHPALKPQAFMRQIVRACLPLGRGVVLDTFMGGGSTIAAAQAIGYESIGIENDPEYFQAAEIGIPKLAAIGVPRQESLPNR
jgi:DNA modification methylase